MCMIFERISCVKMGQCLLLLVCFLSCLCVRAGGASRADEGYPKGLMSVCPGSTKLAEIPKSQLKYLYFVVYSKKLGRKKYDYWNANKIAQDPRVNFKKKTLVVTIGYLDGTNFPISSMFLNLYTARGYNVILVDNQRFATVHYHLATRMMRPVGKHTAEVLVQLVNSGLNPAKLELVGFSLGAHTASYIAKNFRALSGQNISKITGLEPSGPCFRQLEAADRLDASDADFVDVIHSNIDGFGMATRMGHVDIYINGGEFQPADVSIFICTSTCSHFRILALWESALKNPDKFIAIKCDSIQQARDEACYDRIPLETNMMGLRVDKSKKGIFYLSTTTGYPYYRGADGLKKELLTWNTLTNVNDNNDTIIYT